MSVAVRGDVAQGWANNRAEGGRAGGALAPKSGLAQQHFVDLEAVEGDAAGSSQSGAKPEDGEDSGAAPGQATWEGRGADNRLAPAGELSPCPGEIACSDRGDRLDQGMARSSKPKDIVRSQVEQARAGSIVVDGIVTRREWVGGGVAQPSTVGRAGSN